MGYDIVGYRRKTDDESISHIQCLYQWQPKFKEALGGVDIIDSLKGRITNSNRDRLIEDINKIIEMIESQPEMVQLVGCIANKHNDLLVNEFKHLRECIQNKVVGYISAS